MESIFESIIRTAQYKDLHKKGDNIEICSILELSTDFIFVQDSGMEIL